MLMIIFCFMLLWLSCVAFYLVWGKRMKQTLQSPYAGLAKYPWLIRGLAFVLCLFVVLLLHTQLSFSISMVAVWIFLTPVLFIFILKSNSLRVKS